MADPNGLKGNPASKRMGNPIKKATRERSWRNGQARKAARIEAQKKAEARNKGLRAAGLPTPHEAKRDARAARRDADPAVQARAERWRQRRLAA